jgi:hypothetical protein
MPPDTEVTLRPTAPPIPNAAESYLVNAQIRYFTRLPAAQKSNFPKKALPAMRNTV